MRSFELRLLLKLDYLFFNCFSVVSMSLKITKFRTISLSYQIEHPKYVKYSSKGGIFLVEDIEVLSQTVAIVGLVSTERFCLAKGQVVTPAEMPCHLFIHLRAVRFHY